MQLVTDVRIDVLRSFGKERLGLGYQWVGIEVVVDGDKDEDIKVIAVEDGAEDEGGGDNENEGGKTSSEEEVGSGSETGSGTNSRDEGESGDEDRSDNEGESLHEEERSIAIPILMTVPISIGRRRTTVLTTYLDDLYAINR